MICNILKYIYLTAKYYIFKIVARIVIIARIAIIVIAAVAAVELAAAYA